MKFEKLAEQPCSISRSLVIFGDRWTLAIIKQAFARNRRFEEFLEALEISRALLSNRLNRLVEAKVLERIAYESNRVRHEYRLTQSGLDLYPVLQAIRQWGDAYLAPDGPPMLYQHRECGGLIQVELSCSRCPETPTARDVEVAPGPGMSAHRSV